MALAEGESPGDPTIRLGISACLLGEPVRYDGGHKLDRFLTGTLGRTVEWVPVCPEAEVGMGVPRETVDLHDDPQAPRLLGSHSRIDHTASMQAWARARLNQLVALGLYGYVFKKD